MPSSDYTPTLEEVGATTRSRTHDDVGNELGTFTIQTRPDMFAVESLIGRAVAFVEGFAAAGGVSEIGATCYENARQAAIYRVAFLIEIGFFPEQISGDHSPYDEFLQLYKAAINQLARCLGIPNPDDDPPGSAGDVGPETALPQFGFPVHVQSMTDYLEQRSSLSPIDFLGIYLPEDVEELMQFIEVGNNTVFVDGLELTIKRVPMNLSVGVDRVIVASVPGKKIRVIWANALAGPTNSQITFKSKGSGVGTPISPIYDNGAHGGFVFPRDPNGIFETIAGEALTADVTATIGIMIGYIEV